MEFRQETEVQILLKELVMIKARISKLLIQARRGLTTIQDAKIELARQTKEVAEQKEKIVKLDYWLEDINKELKQSTKHTDVLTEDDIVKYMEIYERFIREYEEYEILIQSITVIIRDDSSQLREKLNATRRTLEETRILVIIEVERLRQLLIHIRTAPEVAEDDITQTDRTIDSTSMPEEIVSPRVIEYERQAVKQMIEDPIIPYKVKEENDSDAKTKIQELKMEVDKEYVKPSVTIETQTGKSLMSDAPELVDKSVTCLPEEKITRDISITCVPPKEVEIQTSEPKSEKEILENIQVKQTISDGHETIEIASRPVIREQKTEDQSLFIDAQYMDDNIHKDSKLTITHSLPQSFETVMVEPDETTTEVVVDADGTKRIIVRKIRKTLVTRQQVLTGKPESQMVFSEDIPQDQMMSQLILKRDEGSTSTILDDGGIRHVEYQNYDGQVLAALPEKEVTIHEFTSRPDMVITMEKEMKPEEILQIAERQIQPQIETSSSSVTAIVQQVTKRIVKTKRRIIRRVVVIDGKEHVTEEVVEEPDVEVFEEQIPRVSISVKEGGIVVSDTDDKPDFPPDTDKDDKLQEESKYIEKEDKNEKLKPLSDKEGSVIKTTQDQKQPKESSPLEREVQNLSKEFIVRESEISNIIESSTPTEVTYTQSIKSTETIPEPQPSTEDPIKIKGEHTTLITSGISTFDTISSNVSTVVQQVTRKVTRTRKRIIKHIHIIDGKEHVTEEVIEEPDDVEIFEEEPNVSHLLQEQGDQTKRIKIIRQVNIIDGKEHLTEQIVEDPEDDMNVFQGVTPDTVEIIEEERPGTLTCDNDVEKPKDRSIIDITKNLIEREMDQSALCEPTQKKITSITTKQTDVEPVDLSPFIVEENPEKVNQNYGQSQIQSIITRTRKRIIQHIKVIDGKEYVTEEVIEEPEDFEIVEGEPISTIIQEPQEGLDFSDKIHVRTIKKRSRKRVIKHTQIINGKEHVTEEVIEEPDDVEITECEPKVSHIIQEEGAQTKRIKIIRQVHIINGKEHVTEQVVEEPEDECIAYLDNAANIDVKDLTKTNSEKDSIIVIAEDKNLKQDEKVLPKKISSVKIEIPKPNDLSPVDISRLLIQSETDHTLSLKNTQKDTSDKLEEEKSCPEHKIFETTDKLGKINDTFETPDTPDKSILKKDTEKSKYDKVTRPEVETIVKKITKTDKHIIKHVKVVDGNEHITEEFIEEPDDVEVMVNEPKISHILQEEGAKSKRIKIIRQVQIIDGKEHVTEKVIEDPDDEYHADSTVKTTIDVHVSGLELHQRQKPVDRSLLDLSKELIVSEMGHTSASLIPTQERESGELRKLEPKTEELAKKIDDELKTPSKEHKQVLKDKLCHDIVNISHKPIDLTGQKAIKPDNVKENIKDKKEDKLLKNEVALVSDLDKVPKDTADITVYKKSEEEEKLSKIPDKDCEIISEKFERQNKSLIDTTKNLIKTESQYLDSKEINLPPLEESLEAIKEPQLSVDEKPTVIISSDPIQIENKDICSSSFDKENVCVDKEHIKSKEENVLEGHEAGKRIPAIVQKIETVSKIKSVPQNLKEEKLEHIHDEENIKEKLSVAEPKKELLIDENVSKALDTVDLHLSDDKCESTSVYAKEGPSSAILKDSDETLLSKTPSLDLTKQLIETEISNMEEIVPTQIDLIKTASNELKDEQIPQTLKNITEEFLSQESFPKIDVKKASTLSIEKKSVSEEITETFAPKELDQVIKTIENIYKTPDSSTEIVIKNPVIMTEESLKFKDDSSPSKTRKNIIQQTKELTPSYKEEKRKIKDVLPAQSSVEVDTLDFGTIMSETDINMKEIEPEFSGIQQFKPAVLDSSQETEKCIYTSNLLPSQNKQNIEDLNQLGIIEAPTKEKAYDITAFIEAERLDSHSQHVINSKQEKPASDEKETNDNTSHSIPLNQKYESSKVIDLKEPKQTIDISVGLEKKDDSMEFGPKLGMDIKVQEFENGKPLIIKKDIKGQLPAEINIVEKHLIVEKSHDSQKVDTDLQTVSEELVKDKLNIPFKESDVEPQVIHESVNTESFIDTDNSIAGTESSSLRHYVELQSPTSIESPKPSGDLPEAALSIREEKCDTLSLSTELEHTDERGYEADDTTLGKDTVPERKKRHKKHKSHNISEDTVYPKQTTTDEETVLSTPVEMNEPIPQRKIRSKKGKKSTPASDKSPEEKTESEMIKPESPKLGSEIITNSPQEESYHTLSETSDINTVKIVEECIGSSPEILDKEISTTVTYPVPIVEEIATTEDFVQTSPEGQDSEKDDKIEIPKIETTDSELQTSPTPVSEALIQTTPIDDKEVHTQTCDDITILEKVEVSDSQIQTSRTETPERVITSEVTTQVIPRDIETPDDKFSQTSPIIKEEKQVVGRDSRDIQTSPLPQVQKEEKSSEIAVETTESIIQTINQEVTDKETSTSPTEIVEVQEISVQTPEVPLVTTYTQSDLSIGEEALTKETSPRLPELHLKGKTETVDSSHQTSPRKEFEDVKSEFDVAKKEVIMIDNIQQTSPRIENQFKSPIEDIAKEIVTVDNTQQTTPREVHEMPFVSAVEEIAKPSVLTIDSTQQTTPRGYSEDSMSTSTDEPYEVHLRAQISIPQATNNFIENERQTEQFSGSISSDTHKPRKRKTKRKTESPLQSSGSLSDPINAELSLSVTPTSEDLSSKNTSSIDEGISQLASPVFPHPQIQERHMTGSKPTYSDVVQRSKSKSPSPCKTVFVPKDEKTRLLNAMEKRTLRLNEPRRISEEVLTVALIEPNVEKSYDLVVNKELEEFKNAVKNNDRVKMEKSIIIVIETISIWLEEIQYKIQRQTVTGKQIPDEEERVKTLEKYVQNLKEIVYVTEINEEIITLIETLTRQVTAVSNLNNQTSVLLKEHENKWDKFLSDINTLSQSVDTIKSSLDDIILSEIPTQHKLDILDMIEIDNVNNVESAKTLFQMYRNFIEVNPKKDCPTKLYECNDYIKQIENTINTERDRLLQLSSLAEEYDHTLLDFKHIIDIAEALLGDKIIVSNLDHLHEEIQKHRKFFVYLSHCRAILESLEDNLDNETRTKYSPLHDFLHDRATIMIDRAADRAQKMTLAASRWSVLEQNMKEEKQWLRVAEQRIPDLSNVTSIDNEQYINLYQSVCLDASQHYAKMLRLISISEGLQNLIVCSELESECSIALDTLLKLQEEVNSRLTRLTAFRENWLAYDHLIDRIEGWMKLANKELEHITPDNITTTNNLRRFWELKAQHEVHNNLKNESGAQFDKALAILPISDEMVQRQYFSKVEDKWRDLSSKISNIHTSAIQNISDQDVPSNEKLNILEDEMRELRSMLDSLKGVIKSEDELNLYIERLQVMTGRIDRIQNELGRLSLLPTAESERLGTLLTQSGILDDQIAEELERSLLLKEKIVQVQAGIARCQKSQRRARLTLEECEAAERLSSDVVEGASKTCEKLIEDLSSQWRDILALRQALHTLPIALRVCVSPISIERDISALQDTHSELEAACSDLSVRLRKKLQLWRRYERQLELVQGAVQEADYMVDLLTVQGQVDYDRLLKATEKLETLSESLSHRSGELVGSLREAAAPLQSTIEPTIAAQLRKELDDAAAAYEHTCANLTQLCDKYHKAVDLWKRYRDAAACVRAFAEQHEGALHTLRPADAPAAHQACLEQETRVAELRSLAAQVAAETGSRALQADADALARRLQLVTGAVQALADLGEARQLARAKAQHAKEMFCDMRQDLTPVQEDGEIVEDKLIALRDNLIALGKSEADIAPAKAELPDIDRDVEDEHSIVRILELWQAMFRDTFLHYHRLSTALVRSGDAATALRLWNEYLLDLQSFLSGTVPADYENLTEHRRLCRVHRNLLTSQRSVLMNENIETKNRDLADKFDTLTNLHNETLARIVERHDEVCTRIAAWDEYRRIYTELLRWLKEIEREKEKLQLRYVHIKRIHKILAKIQNLVDKLPEGRKLTDKLLQNLKKVLVFTEETYAASVRMEYAGIVKRVENLQASLDTWRDFLTRILGLIGEYETLTDDLQNLYSKAQDEYLVFYLDVDSSSRPQLKKIIDKCTDIRTKIDKTETQIEALSVIQEQLKECLSPPDIRIVNQKVTLLRQRRGDLEHQLSILIHTLQERLEIYTIFDSRLSRFSEWLTTVESRLETTSTNDIGAFDPQDLIRRIASDIQAEITLKEREFEWLVETGSNLVELSKKDEKSYSKNTLKKLKDIQERVHKLEETGRNRIDKINDLLETISKLEERLTEIRLKLHTIESSLMTSVVLEHLTTKAVDAKFQDRDEIHKSIENESGEVGKTLNHCELVFNDSDVLKGNFDLRNLRTGVDIVEKKWKNICDMSEQRKKALKEIRKSVELVNSLLPKLEKKLDAIEKRVEKIETRKQRGEPGDESISKGVLKDLNSLESDINKLEDAYNRIVSARGVEVRGAAADDASRLRSSVRKWQQLRGRLDTAGADVHKLFVATHGKAVVALAEADVRLTRALHLSPTPTDKVATLKELDGVEEDLRECASLVDEADRLSASVASIAGVSDMVGEYRALYADVRTRLDLGRAEVVGDVDSAVQVDTLKWETDAALQVDTLTSKETYRNELVTAVKETSESLEELRTALLQEIKENAKSDELANAAKEIAKAGAKPEQTLELAKHLSELLLTECDATEQEAMLKEVESLSLRYEDLLTQAKKRELQINNLRLPHSASYALTCEHESGRLTCPLCSDRNWKQLDNDLWRLEQWLQFAEATDEARVDPPEQYDALEDTIQDHREFLLDLDSHKALVVSLNVVGAHVTRHARSAQDATRVQERLAAANARWDAACSRAAAWQSRLQAALVNNREFHDIVVELVSQLAAAERSVRAREPLRLSRPAAALRADFRRFSELRDELSRAEPRVLALRDAAMLLTDEAQDVCRRLGELRLRLQSLRKLAGVYALKLGAALARSPEHGSALAAAAASAATAAQLMEEEPPTLPPLDESLTEEHEEQQLSSVQRGLRFVSRVARASLPFQALLLLLLGAAALVPLSPGDCRGPSLQPVLRYPHGPPPL